MIDARTLSMGRNKVADILVKRDGFTYDEAYAQIKECIEALEDGQYDAIQYYLGLEDDYIFDIL